MNEQLDKLIRDARTIADNTRSSFGKLSSTQLNWKPSAERWSIAQCFDHLVNANQGYLPIIESVRTGTKQTTFWERLPVLPGLAGKLLIKSLDPASTRKIKAPKRFEPAQSNISASVIDDFAAQQDKIIAGMNATSHLDLEKIVITSPAVSAALSPTAFWTPTASSSSTNYGTSSRPRGSLPNRAFRPQITQIRN